MQSTPPPPALALRRATTADWRLIRQWIALPDIQRWWGSPAAAEAEIRMALDGEAAISCLVMLGEEPIGYAHAIDAAHWGPSLPDGMPAGTWDIDVFIATPEHRGKGLGEAAVNLLAAEVFATTLALALSVFVPVTNERAVRA
ncbi:MAG: GNAT family N-acetyltransferase, partial [Hyphomicrobiaceae bacterium]